jgi:gluconate 2-dehydrogenase gamma chain
MTDDRPFSRRRFIQVSTLAVVSAGAFGCARFQRAPSLTAEEFAAVEAIADQIIPPDHDAGGREAGVAWFIERQLRGPYRRFAPAYVSGLERLERTSVHLHGAGFTRLTFDQQTRLLAAMERNQVPAAIWQPGQAAGFFRMVCDHCMQGFYGSPRHGGNRDYASWRMLGLDYPQLAGRAVL